jgi:DNA-directed RNA polymerase specialized sigma24 family protein
MGTAIRRSREHRAQIDEIALLLHGEEGRRLARTVRTNNGRHLEVEELVSEAMIGIIRAIDRGLEILDPLGYAYGIMRNATLRAVGGREALIDPTTYRFVNTEDATVVGGDRTPGPDGRDHIDQAEVDRLFDEIRIAVEASSAPVAIRAAALARLTLGDAEGIDVSDLPAPVAGAAPDDAMWWPCAFLAARDTRLFPSDGRAGQAARKARSRFISAAKALFHQIQDR